MNPDEEPEVLRVPLVEDLREGAVGPAAVDERQTLVRQNDEARLGAEELLRQRISRRLQGPERVTRIQTPRRRLQFEAAEKPAGDIRRDLLDDEVRHLAADGARRDPPERRGRRLSVDVGEGEQQPASRTADDAHHFVPSPPQRLGQGIV